MAAEAAGTSAGSNKLVLLLGLLPEEDPRENRWRGDDDDSGALPDWGRVWRHGGLDARADAGVLAGGGGL